MSTSDLLKLFTPGTDNHHVLKYLMDNGRSYVCDIQRSFGGDGTNKAVRSRVTDINKIIGLHGWLIKGEKNKVYKCWDYWLEKVEKKEEVKFVGNQAVMGF